MHGFAEMMDGWDWHFISNVNTWGARKIKHQGFNISPFAARPTTPSRRKWVVLRHRPSNYPTRLISLTFIPMQQSRKSRSTRNKPYCVIHSTRIHYLCLCHPEDLVPRHSTYWTHRRPASMGLHPLGKKPYQSSLSLLRYLAVINAQRCGLSNGGVVKSCGYMANAPWSCCVIAILGKHALK